MKGHTMHQIDFVASNITSLTGPLSRADEAVVRADRIGDTKASILARVIANVHDMSISELFHHTRSRAPIAATRQLAMYMMHVVLGRNLTQVGAFFGRDRTTVAYACMRVEDMRDDEGFDTQIENIEVAYEQALGNGISGQNFVTPEHAND